MFASPYLVKFGFRPGAISRQERLFTSKLRISDFFPIDADIMKVE